MSERPPEPGPDSDRPISQAINPGPAEGPPSERLANHFSTKQLVFWLVVGALLVLAFGLVSHRTIDLLESLLGTTIHHWTSWEIGALTWTAALTVFFYWFFPLDQIPVWIVRSIVIPLIVLSVCSLGWALWALQKHDYLSHLGAVSLAVLLFLVLDWTLAFQLKKAGEVQAAREFREALVLIDIPMFVSFLTLLGYVLLHGHCCEVQETLGVFLAGAISFHLVLSNILFAVVQSGMVRRLGTD